MVERKFLEVVEAEVQFVRCPDDEELVHVGVRIDGSVVNFDVTRDILRKFLRVGKLVVSGRACAFSIGGKITSSEQLEERDGRTGHIVH